VTQAIEQLLTTEEPARATVGAYGCTPRGLFSSIRPTAPTHPQVFQSLQKLVQGGTTTANEQTPRQQAIKQLSGLMETVRSMMQDPVLPSASQAMPSPPPSRRVGVAPRDEPAPSAPNGGLAFHGHHEPEPGRPSLGVCEGRAHARACVLATTGPHAIRAAVAPRTLVGTATRKQSQSRR
jgi:hypothetical protein